MRRDSRVDANQGELVDAWKKLGGTWLHLHMLGGGAPDGLAGMAGEMELVEIKDGTNTLNDKQCEWHERWRGPRPRIWRTLDDVEALARDLRARAA